MFIEIYMFVWEIVMEVFLFFFEMLVEVMSNFVKVLLDEVRYIIVDVYVDL